MKGGISKRNAVLIQVIAYGNLTTECVTTAIQINFIILVITCLNQNRNIQIGHTNGIDDTDFKTEIGQ